MRVLQKYLSLYWSFLRASLMSDIEYRFNIVTKVIGDVFWYVAQAGVFEVLFLHVNQISGWDLPAARVFMAMLFFVDCIWMVLFHENFERLSWKVRRGDLDLLLTKPVSSQFLVTLQKQNTAYLANLILTTGYLIWTISLLPYSIPPERYLLLVIAVPVSLSVVYSCRFFFSVLAVIYANADAVGYIWYQLYRLGMRPDALYPWWLRYIVLSFLPVAFIASVPTRLLLFTPDWRLVLSGVVIAAVLVHLTTVFWRYALKRYSSASS